MTYRTNVVADRSPQLDAVKKLWRKASATLGFFPDGAFSEYAQKRQIIAAERGGLVLGYTLFRRTGTRAAIVHLCVDPGERGQGIARKLVGEISRVAADADGLSLRCRCDFEADKLWPKLGFRPVREIRGRGKNGEPLTLWFKNHGNDDLFTLAARKGEPKTVAVIDANVFFDLAEAEERATNESKALQADWLRDIVELKITEELFSEIRRHEDVEVRRRNLDFARQFEVLGVDPEALAVANREVDELLPPPKNQRDRSDRAHLAACMAARVDYFVTRDELLQELGEVLREKTEVTVLRPSEFIADLDEIERGEAYRPARLAGTLLRLLPAKELPEEGIAETFRGQQRRSEFLAILRRHIAEPRTSETNVVLAGDRPVALVSLGNAADRCLEVGLLRTAGNEARTLAAYLAHHIRAEALERSASIVMVEDQGLDSHSRAALENDEFTLVGSAWLRAVCRVVGVRGEIRSWAETSRELTIRPLVRKFLEDLEAEGLFADSTSTALLERRVWPAKVLDGTLPTFVVPVRPYWAQQLFDAELAKLDLFGAHPHLAMSRENVYYRSPSNPATIPFPARVLWYVSEDARTPGTKAVRACSRLVEVTVSSPKLAFKASRRLGIYEWKDVAETAQNSRGLVQTLRFCDTECFPVPVWLSTVRDILGECQAAGVNDSFPSPQLVPESVFAAIYRAGMGRGAPQRVG